MLIEEFERALIGFVRDVYVTMGWPGVVALMALESTCVCVPIPSEAVMPLAGWMLVREQGLGFWHTLLAGFYGAVGCTIGAWIAYAFGVFGGRTFLERYGKYVLVSAADLETADRWFAKYGDAAVFLSRMVPLVRTVMSIPAGVVRMPFGRFTFFTLAGSLPWCWGLAIGGYYLGEHYEELREITRPFDIAIVAALVALIALYVYHHVKSSRVHA